MTGGGTEGSDVDSCEYRQPKPTLSRTERRNAVSCLSRNVLMLNDHRQLQSIGECHWGRMNEFQFRFCQRLLMITEHRQPQPTLNGREQGVVDSCLTQVSVDWNMTESKRYLLILFPGMLVLNE